jgi:hypothetical protein
MALPANIRVNVRVPFPALVTGSGPVTVTKVNGIWTIGLNAGLLVTQNPPVNFAADLVFVWDPVAKTFILAPLSGLIAAPGRQQRSITTNGGGAHSLPVLANDSVLNINNAGDLVPVVPLASTRNGAPLSFKNLPGSHVQTLTRTAPDTFDGANTILLQPGAEISLRPYNDGVNAGYAIE